MRKLWWLFLCSGISIAETDSTLDMIKAKTKLLEQTIHQARFKSKADADLTPAERQLRQLEIRTQETQAKLKAQNAKIFQAEAHIQSLESQRNKQQQLLATQVRTEARHPAAEGVKLLLTCNDVAQMQRLLHGYQIIRKTQRNSLNQLAIQLEQHKKDKTALLEEKSALAQMESELLRQQASVNKKRELAILKTKS